QRLAERRGGGGAHLAGRRERNPAAQPAVHGADGDDGAAGRRAAPGRSPAGLPASTRNARALMRQHGSDAGGEWPGEAARSLAPAFTQPGLAAIASSSTRSV